ncbi:MAG: carboxymuconolactone decarboxylase family protein [Steroidobacteraceae bacterium]
MAKFDFHDLTTAPPASKPILEGVAKELGFVPALYAGLAESPTALRIYLDTSRAFGASSLTPVEQQVVLLAVSVANGCEFCVAAHSFIARNLVKVPSPVVDALRAKGRLPDSRLHELAQFTRRVVTDRGWVPDAAVEEFLSAGFTRAQVLDVIVGVSHKTLSNYANHLLRTPVDPAFASEVWSSVGA